MCLKAYPARQRNTQSGDLGAGFCSNLPEEGDLYFGAGGELVNFRATLAELVRMAGAVIANVSDPSPMWALEVGAQPTPASAAGPGNPVAPSARTEVGSSSGASLVPPPPSATASGGPTTLPPSTTALLRFHRHPRFLVDCMMGRLSRWLRIIGCDTEFIDERNHARLIAWSEREDRIILTRDRKVRRLVVVGGCPCRASNDCVSLSVACFAQFLERKDVRACFFLPTHDTAQQFTMVTEHFGIMCSSRDLMSRCAKCNGEVGDEHRLQCRCCVAFTWPSLPDGLAVLCYPGLRQAVRRRCA